MTRAIFSSSGYSPLFRQELKTLLRKEARENLAALNNFVGISSYPGALLGFNLLMISIISSSLVSSI